jgi:hypothetical protein
MARNATKRQAEAVLAQVRVRYKAHWQGDPEFGIPDETGPVLLENWDWVGLVRWAIVWEEGPYEWAIDFSPTIKGVYGEAITSWSLGVFPT